MAFASLFVEQVRIHGGSVNGGASPPSARGALAFVFQVPIATLHQGLTQHISPIFIVLSPGIGQRACVASEWHQHMLCVTSSAWLQELTRQETNLYVHACTAVPPHFLPLVATRLQLPAPVRPLCSAANAKSCFHRHNAVQPDAVLLHLYC